MRIEILNIIVNKYLSLIEKIAFLEHSQFLKQLFQLFIFLLILTENKQLEFLWLSTKIIDLYLLDLPLLFYLTQLFITTR